MFVGWQLQEDFNALSKLGSGTLKINALDGTNEFNNKKIHQLNITEILCSWLLNDMAQYHIQKNEIKEAILNVDIMVKKPKYGSRFTKFSFLCNSSIVEKNKTYNHRLEDVQEFECKKI